MTWTLVLGSPTTCYYLHGIPEDPLVSIFAIGRAAGWVVQLIERLAKHMLIRPLTQYLGPPSGRTPRSEHASE